MNYYTRLAWQNTGNRYNTEKRKQKWLIISKGKLCKPKIWYRTDISAIWGTQHSSKKYPLKQTGQKF